MSDIKSYTDYVDNESEPTNINEISEMIGELREAIQKEYFGAGFKAGAGSRQAEIDEVKCLNSVLANYINKSIHNVQDLLTEIEKLTARVAVAEGGNAELEAEIQKLREVLEGIKHQISVEIESRFGSYSHGEALIFESIEQVLNTPSTTTWDLLPEDKKELKDDRL